MLPDGIHTTMRNDGENQRLRRPIILIMPRIICSAALKSAITPSRRGRTVFTLSCPFSYISRARAPTAITLPLPSNEMTLGSSRTILPSLTIIVLAVPRSIANSCLKEKNPIYFSYTFCSLMFKMTDTAK